MHAMQFVDGASGNLSARLAPGRLLVTPAGVPKGFLEPEQLLIVDESGQLLDGPPGSEATSELSMHLEAYRRRPDVGGVVHAHPIACVALSLTGHSLSEPVIPEAIVLLGPVPMLPYATPSTAENRAAISEAIVHHDALVLSNHGSLTVGRDVWQAYLRLETLEHTAKILAQAYALGEVRPLPPDQVAKLLAQRDQLREKHARPAGQPRALTETPSA